MRPAAGSKNGRRYATPTTTIDQSLSKRPRSENNFSGGVGWQSFIGVGILPVRIKLSRPSLSQRIHDLPPIMTDRPSELDALIARIFPGVEEQAARKQIFRLDESELAVIRELKQKLAGREATLIDDLGEYLGKFQGISAAFDDPARMAEIRKQQRGYFSQFLSSELDEDYVRERVRAGVVQQSHHLRLRWFLGSFAFYLDRLLPEVLKIAGGDTQKLTDYYRVLTRLAMFDIALTVSAFVHADREELRVFSTVFETNLEGVFIADTHGTILHGNKSVTVVMGYTPQEIIGKSLRELHADDNRDTFDEVLAAVLAGGQWQGETMLRRQSGEAFPSWMNVTGAKDNKGIVTHIIVEFSDITTFKQTQQALVSRTDELARSNRELEQFAYVASHDLQEPLRMVASYTQLLARRYKDKLDEDANEFIHYAVDGAMRMQALINDLLTISRVGTRGKPLQPCESGLSLEHALINLRMAIEETGAEVTHDPMPRVMADVSQLTQLLQNLIGNAIKFHGGEKPRIHIGAQRRGHDWVISVKDNGIGIAPEFFERIFVIFQRLHGKQEYPGTGIGLAVCKKIVERHGGTIWVESEPDQGATFLFTLSAAPEKE
jgi:chemotaxis family two-component system sensor kinase Cph1